MPRDLPVRSDRRQADRRYRRRDDYVGLGLSAHRRRVAGVAEIHRRAVRWIAGGRRAQDHLRERRKVLSASELTNPPGSSSPKRSPLPPVGEGFLLTAPATNSRHRDERRASAPPKKKGRGFFFSRFLEPPHAAPPPPARPWPPPP